MLDFKDKKLLFELDLDCRQSFKQLGRKLRLSKETVFYRVKRLEETGIIQSYSTMVDIGKLGFMSFRILLKLQDTTSKKEQEIINYLENQKLVGWFVTIEGNWDLNLWILCKNLVELNKFWADFNSLFINYIERHELAVFTNLTYFSKSYLVDKKNEHQFKFVSLPQNLQVHELDLAILEIMASNARVPLVEIAEKLGVSHKTIASRIKNMEKNKIIIGYKPLLDLEKLGYLYYKAHFRLHSVTSEKEKEFRNYIFQHPNIVYDDSLIGGANIEIDIQVDNVQTLRNIIKEIKNKFSSIIKDYEIMQYLKEYKYLLVPPNFNK
ncbi:MAG: Lrp/AsnC family transcriptional regulator [archaeon]|nr:Lrp/AsnC family transcriptional regulator [archaeon]